MTDTEHEEMETLPYSQVVAPFAKINYWHQSDGGRRIRAYIPMENIKEGAQTGVAIQASEPMRDAFGFVGWMGRLFKRRTGLNVVSLTAQKMCSYLARKVDADTKTTAIYWGTGTGGTDIEEIGDLTAYHAEQYSFAGPQRFGSSASLLPAVRYFVDRFADAPWGIYIFITDGRLRDLDAVKQYTVRLAHDIAAGRRNGLKLVMIGVGRRMDSFPMRRLDDLDTETEVDLWDYKIAAEMRSLVEIFAEVVDENTIVANRGLIRDSSGTILRDYRARGVPALLEFTLPLGAKSFTLEIGDQPFTQPI